MTTENLTLINERIKRLLTWILEEDKSQGGRPYYSPTGATEIAFAPGNNLGNFGTLPWLACQLTA